MIQRRRYPLAMARRRVGHVKNCLASGTTSNSVTANSVPIAAATSRLSRCNAILRRATPSAIPANANRVATAGCNQTMFNAWDKLIITKPYPSKCFDYRNWSRIDLKRDLMTCPGARVGKRLATLRNKFPIVTDCVKGEFQHSKRIRQPHFAVGLRTCEGAV